MKIGAITVGQSPRTDVMKDIQDIFKDKAEILQKGALDGLTRDEIAKFTPEEGDYVLVSRLTDGSSVTFAERYVLPIIQKCINELEKEGVKLIMFFCTGTFPDTLTSNVPLIYPCNILHSIVPILSKNSSIITFTPSKLQVEQCEIKWRSYVDKAVSLAASPYGDFEEIINAAEKAKDMEGDLIVLDCIGFSQEMKEAAARISGKLVILPRTLLARVISELTDIKEAENE